MEPLSYIDRAELIQIFSAESEENLREMEVAFVQLESTPQDEETLQAIFRAAHTIKGNAAGLGYPALAKFAHAVEDVLDGLRTGAIVLTTPLATILLAVGGRAAPARDRRRSRGRDELLPEHLELIEDSDDRGRRSRTAPIVARRATGAPAGRRRSDLAARLRVPDAPRRDREAGSDAQPDR